MAAGLSQGCDPIWEVQIVWNSNQVLYMHQIANIYTLDAFLPESTMHVCDVFMFVRGIVKNCRISGFTKGYSEMFLTVLFSERDEIPQYTTATQNAWPLYFILDRLVLSPIPIDLRPGKSSSLEIEKTPSLDNVTEENKYPSSLPFHWSAMPARAKPTSIEIKGQDKILPSTTPKRPSPNATPPKLVQLLSPKSRFARKSGEALPPLPYAWSTPLPLGRPKARSSSRKSSPYEVWSHSPLSNPPRVPSPDPTPPKLSDSAYQSYKVTSQLSNDVTHEKEGVSSSGTIDSITTKNTDKTKLATSPASRQDISSTRELRRHDIETTSLPYPASGNLSLQLSVRTGNSPQPSSVSSEFVDLLGLPFDTPRTQTSCRAIKTHPLNSISSEVSKAPSILSSDPCSLSSARSVQSRHSTNEYSELLNMRCTPSSLLISPSLIRKTKLSQLRDTSSVELDLPDTTVVDLSSPETLQILCDWRTSQQRNAELEPTTTVSTIPQIQSRLFFSAYLHFNPIDLILSLAYRKYSILPTI